MSNIIGVSPDLIQRVAPVMTALAAVLENIIDEEVNQEQFSNAFTDFFMAVYLTYDRERLLSDVALLNMAASISVQGPVAIEPYIDPDKADA